MPALPHRRIPLLLVAVAVVAALLTAPAAQGDSPAAPDAGRDLDKLSAISTSPQAARALDAVDDVFEKGRGDATLALRDLALVKGELTGADRAAAERRLSRPGGLGKRICSDVVCVHYTTTGADKATDDYAQTALGTVSGVHRLFVGAGYRAPKPDGTRGGDARTDIYLGDIGDDGIYGYCSTDEESSTAPWDRWAYCVLDNDYAKDEFPTNTPLENLQVTAAHEYFHAVQFAYDFSEDGWLLEATAAWVEDVVFDDVDDNVQYLQAESPLKQPRISMDRFGGLRHYGAWIFFRYLTDRFPAAKGGMPTLVRDIIRKTDGSTGAPDLYSWQAVSNVLKARGTTAGQAFAAFAAANRRPAQTYDEGAANRYPTPPIIARTTVARPVRSEVTLNHLTSATYRYLPAKALAAKSWKLRLNVDMQATSRGSAALVTTYLRSGRVQVRWVRLGKKGNGFRTVPFSRTTVKKVEITLVNASGRFTCWRSTPFSCSGKPKDDQLRQQVSVRPVRG